MHTKEVRPHKQKLVSMFVTVSSSIRGPFCFKLIGVIFDAYLSVLHLMLPRASYRNMTIAATVVTHAVLMSVVSEIRTYIDRQFMIRVKLPSLSADMASIAVTATTSTTSKAARVVWV